LEQEFNSLDAQYEACAAFALSQRHEGWTLSPERYDDGGFSGGSMERPGLRRLLADVEAGKIDVILVYKIDRLTRSLADFARIVDVLDAKGASFVSITQAFNTTTSMGRLTLNVLLSFAQFEREVTAERIRDKIAASKKKGLWMGGPVPLGYDVQDRRLVVNEEEAALVRHIMQRYLELKSVPRLVASLQEQGYKTKIQIRASGPHRGGCKFTRGTLYHLLANRIYLGELSHKGEHFAAEHGSIVPVDLFNAVQALIARNSSGLSRRTKTGSINLLTGLMTDGEGRAMTPSHATKSGKRYRYYVTRAELARETPAWRVPAGDLEQLVCQQLAARLADQAFLLDIAGDVPAQAIQTMLRKADLAAAALRSGANRERLPLITGLIERIELHDEAVQLTLRRHVLHAELGLEPPPPSRTASEPLVLSMPVQKVRRGHQLRLVVPGAVPRLDATIPLSERDVGDESPSLLTLLARAREARMLLSRPGACPDKTAVQLGQSCDQVLRLARLGCLAPDIVEAITDGRSPNGLTASKLLDGPLPSKWSEQRARFVIDHRS
ncbi:MAG: recombinase family protein, partial [Burkholderiales bacterium]